MEKTDEIGKLLGLQITTVRNHRARASEKNLCSFQELLERYKFWEE